MNIYANHDLTEISFLRGWSKEEDKQTGSLGMPPLYTVVTIDLLLS